MKSAEPDIAARFVDGDQPAISVDRKKTELIGDHANGGEWSPAGEPERDQVYDFADRSLGEFAKAIPYGDRRRRRQRRPGLCRLFTDTAEFAADSIHRWWNQMGRQRFPQAEQLLITADSGGSNGYQLRASMVHSPGSPPRPDCPSRSVNTRPAPRTGTGSSTACSASSR
jgi:Rhodopirellula transposase DDE domain